MTMQWLRDLPSTNFRIFVGVSLLIFVVLGLLWAVLTGRKIQLDISIVLVTTLLTTMGLDVAQFKVKRDSYIESPPARADIEDVPKPKTAPDPKPGDA